MDLRVVGFVLGLAVVVAPSATLADSAPQFVIPGRTPGPIIINGWDARWAVVEGDFGLNRPGHMPQVVIGGRYVGPRYDRFRRTQYYPTDKSNPPVQGRHEIVPQPDPQAPQESENFSRSWETAPASDPVVPSDVPNSGNNMLPILPPVIVAPRIGPKP